MKSGLQALVVLILTCSHAVVNTLANLQPNRQSFLQTKAPQIPMGGRAAQMISALMGLLATTYMLSTKHRGNSTVSGMLPG